MKKKALILTLICIIMFLVSFINTLVGLNLWDFNPGFLREIEFFTFVLQHIFTLIAVIYSIRMIRKYKSPFYLISLLIPVALVLLNWYLFYIRIINEIFFR